MQVDPLRLTFEPSGTERLTLKHDEPPSNVAFKLKLRRYTTVLKIAVEHTLRVKSVSGKSVSNLASFLTKNCKHSPLGGSSERCLQTRINIALLGLVKLASLQTQTTAKHSRQFPRNAVSHRIQAAHVLTTKSGARQGLPRSLFGST